jgi:pimeloyl-ACP methyl ester carboxylesterase
MSAVAATRPRIPRGFERLQIRVNGNDVVLYARGSGQPVVFLHGAGTASGFNFSAAWADEFRVYLPYHPGFGESPDSAAIGSISDYVLHYLELMDLLKLGQVRLVGLSLGGWIAATLATQSSHRLQKLVLVAPAGLRIPEHPTLDIFRLKPEEVPAHLVCDPAALAPYVPDPHSPEFLDFLANDYHEMSSFARLAWERPYDRDLAKWLHRIRVPTLLVYGDRDRITPVEQSKTWAALIPGAETHIVKEAGHLVLEEKKEAAQAILDFLRS